MSLLKRVNGGPLATQNRKMRCVATIPGASLPSASHITSGLMCLPALHSCLLVDSVVRRPWARAFSSVASAHSLRKRSAAECDPHAL